MQSTPPRKGFTLIELLVVVAVIGILIAVLLPALAATRARGQQLKDQAIQKDLVTGLLSYASDADNEIPGWNTTGRNVRAGTLAQDLEGSNAPTQSCDWISMTTALDLPANRASRLFSILSTLQDPTQSGVYSASDLLNADAELVNVANDNGGLPSISYTMPSSWQNTGLTPPVPRVADPIVNFTEDEQLVEYPDSWFPRVSGIRRQSTKVAVTNSFSNCNDVSVNAAFHPVDGEYASSFFVSASPSLSVSNQFYETFEGTVIPSDLAFRHSGQSINVTHWDGHGSTLEFGDAVAPRYWYPSASNWLGNGQPIQHLVDNLERYRPEVARGLVHARLSA